MGIVREYFKFFLCDKATYNAYYVDSMGHVTLGNVRDGNDYALPQSPGGWDDIQISFGRNDHYWGLNRTFTIPLKFIGDGAKIIRTLSYGGRGIETPLLLIVLKWDDVKGYFRLYYSGQIDFTQADDFASDSFTVNVMQGGVVQLLKAYEQTIFELPLDGSIPQNIKINADGILFNDTFHYQILKVTPAAAGVNTLAMAFIKNDGDNIGIVHNDQELQSIASTNNGYFQSSSNYTFTSVTPVKVRIKGSITVKPDFRENDTHFYMYTATSFSQPLGVDGLSNAKGLVGPGNYIPDEPAAWVPQEIKITNQTVFNFDVTVSLGANENLFINFFNNFAQYPTQIIGGNVDLIFSSRYLASRIWAMTAADVFYLLGKRTNSLSANFEQIYNYLYVSGLLESLRRIVFTSGDAIRASTDPNYFQYYNQATLNPANPNNQDYTQFATLGPTLKICWSDFFDSINPVFNAALGNTQAEGQQEALFIESKRTVLNPDTVTMVCDNITNFHITPALDYMWNWLQIGYQPNDYDETSGKFEYNNTNSYQAPIKSLQKTLQLISKARTDSYGFEFTRFNTQGGKSSTFNDSDSDYWMVNIDQTKSIRDFFEASYVSNVTNPGSSSNTDIKLNDRENFQPVLFITLDGEYFTDNIDYSIFIFNQVIAESPYVATIQMSALLNGLIGDSARIQMWYNGNSIREWTQAITGVNTPFTIDTDIPISIAFKDCIFFTVDTIKTCTIDIDTFSMNVVGGQSFLASAIGITSLPAGSTQQLISLPNITATIVNTYPVISYGYQYFTFLSNVNNTQFDWAFIIDGFIQGNANEILTFDVWKNGVIIGEIVYHGTSGQTQFNPTRAAQLSGNIVFALYDRLWVTASQTNLTAYIIYADLKLTSNILAYNLNRPSVTGLSDNSAYDNIAGIPNPQTAFNLPDFTPATMVRANASLLSSTLINQMPGQLLFQTASKNQFLSTTKTGVTITENASFDIHDLSDSPLFLPFILEFDTTVPDNFADLLNNAANGHIQVNYRGKTFYGFPLTVTAKPALNESQSWKLLCSPKTNINDFIDLDWTGIINLLFMDISVPYVCPLHFYPTKLQRDARYNSATMDEAPFKERVKGWTAAENYFAPWQTNDVIDLQIQTNSLSPVMVQAYDSNNRPFGAAVELPEVTDSAVQNPQLLFQGSIPLNAFANNGKYYFKLTAGVGEGASVLQSEPIYVKTKWHKTQLYQFKNTFNHLATIFTTGYYPSVRLHSKIIRHKGGKKANTFVNQPQDIILTNAIPFDVWKLEIAFDTGIPDYMERKIDRITGSLDTVFIDGTQYTRNADDEFDQTTFAGQPKVFLSVDIRKAKNSDAMTYNSAGQLTDDMSGGYTLDAAAFGQTNNGQQLIKIGEINS